MDTLLPSIVSVISMTTSTKLFPTRTTFLPGWNVAKTRLRRTRVAGVGRAIPVARSEADRYRLQWAYMNDLTKLCLKDNNLILVHDLKEAMTEAHISLLQKLWCEIESALKEVIPALPDKDDEQSDISKERISRFVKDSRNFQYHGLYYTLSSAASLGVIVENTIYLCVGCNQEDHEEEYYALMRACKNISGGKPDQKNPWWQYADGDLNLKYPTRKTLSFC